MLDEVSNANPTGTQRSHHIEIGSQLFVVADVTVNVDRRISLELPKRSHNRLSRDHSLVLRDERENDWNSTLFSVETGLQQRAL